jgi:hypothetical protein
MKSTGRHRVLEEYIRTDPCYATFCRALGMAGLVCVLSISMTMSVVFLVAKSKEFRCWVCVCACQCQCHCTSVGLWRYIMYTFKLNNLGKVTVIYILYILGKTMNLVKQ